MITPDEKALLVEKMLPEIWNLITQWDREEVADPRTIVVAVQMACAQYIKQRSRTQEERVAVYLKILQTMAIDLEITVEEIGFEELK